MTPTCVIGANGNMGRRYMAILEYLNQQPCGVDIGEPVPFTRHYIIATPTETHLDVLAKLIDQHGTNGDLRILIEKPVTKNPDHFDFVLGTKNKIYMVNQYAYAANQGRIPKGIGTSYDYYNSGTDGLAWDCIQLLHLAEGPVWLHTKSPVWRCKVNGRWIPRDSVDHLYIKMIKDFISDNRAHGKLWGPEDIIKAHEKVLRYEETINRGTGPQRVNPAQK
jgi:hypothetical protein